MNRDESRPSQLAKDWEDLRSLLVLERMLDKQLDRLESKYQWNCRKFVYLRALDCEGSQLQVLATRLQRSSLVSLMLRSALEETFLEKNRLADKLRHQQPKWGSEDATSCAPHQDQDKHQLLTASYRPASGEYSSNQLKGGSIKLSMVRAQCAAYHRQDSKTLRPCHNSPSFVGVQCNKQVPCQNSPSDVGVQCNKQVPCQNSPSDVGVQCNKQVPCQNSSLDVVIPSLPALNSSVSCVPAAYKRPRISFQRRGSTTTYVRDNPYYSTTSIRDNPFYCLSKQPTVSLKMSHLAWSKRAQHRRLSLKQLQEDTGRTRHNHLLCPLDSLCPLVVKDSPVSPACVLCQTLTNG